MTPQDILKIARAEIGYREGPNNQTKYGKWYGLDHNPWCMMFVQWVFAQAGHPLECRSASCSEMRAFYLVHRPSMCHYTPKVGDIVIYNGHTGIVAEVNLLGNYFYAIEGNYSDKVTAVKRKFKEAIMYIRPDYDEEVQELIYHHPDTVPDWGQSAVRWAIDNGILKGAAVDDLGISEDTLKTVVMLHRYHTMKEGIK